MTSDTKKTDRTAVQYRQGRAAYRDGDKPEDTCPYPIGNGNRTSWMTGWLDSRTVDRIGHVFDARGMSYP